MWIYANCLPQSRGLHTVNSLQSFQQPPANKTVTARLAASTFRTGDKPLCSGGRRAAPPTRPAQAINGRISLQREKPLSGSTAAAQALAGGELGLRRWPPSRLGNEAGTWGHCLAVFPSRLVNLYNLRTRPAQGGWSFTPTLPSESGPGRTPRPAAPSEALREDETPRRKTQARCRGACPVHGHAPFSEAPANQERVVTSSSHGAARNGKEETAVPGRGPVPMQTADACRG